MLRQLENKTNMKIAHLDTCSRKRDAAGTREEGIDVGSDDWGSACRFIEYEFGPKMIERRWILEAGS